MVFCLGYASAQSQKVKIDVEKRGNIVKQTISADEMQALRNHCAIIKQNHAQEFGGFTNNAKFRESVNIQIIEYLNSVDAPSSIHFLFLE